MSLGESAGFLRLLPCGVVRRGMGPSPLSQPSGVTHWLKNPIFSIVLCGFLAVKGPKINFAKVFKTNHAITTG